MGDQLVIAYDFLLVSAIPVLLPPAILPIHAGAGDVGGFAVDSIKLLVARSFWYDADDGPLDMLDKYDEVVLLPLVVATFVVDFGDQLVMEYDFVSFVESFLAIFPIELDEGLVGKGAAGGADAVLVLEPYKNETDCGVLAADAFDKYDSFV